MVRHPMRLKTGKSKGIDVFFQGNPVLQPNRNRNGKTIEKATISRPFLIHINKNLPQLFIFILPCPDKKLMPPHRRLKSKTFPLQGGGAAYTARAIFFLDVCFF